MDLKTFVTESLTQILDGVREAQKRPGGENVGADGYINPTSGNLMPGGTSGFFTLVDFDVSVVAEAKEGGTSVRVASAEMSDGSSRSLQNASRVKFSVHVRLPQGGQNRDQSRY
ncbi:hypothetical protein GFB56_05495 [Ensifer sp. T173]|uniref:Curli production assembly/transport component CsgF n=1 Tax=Ensifer canadensis TaxID=555315 RepID=A0AAW4FDS0_9HYPH|nr:hypothetical protein [Ensifer canadensis]MBM3090267.1 hypothetical protein [Ensifer canadensis]UBI75801.1 hypothetical protein J3R84_01170 [Ensifer canadensis]